MTDKDPKLNAHNRPLKIKEGDKRRSPEHIEHLKEIGRKKGSPKVPGSGRKALPADIKEALSDFSFEAIEILKDLALNGTNENARRQAAEYFLNPFVSKAVQQVDVSVRHSIAEMLAEVNQQKLKKDDRNSKIIDITPVSNDGKDSDE